MKQKVLLTLCIVMQALLASFPAHPANRDVCSTCSYTSVDAAISAAQSGDLIRIAAGTYEGSVTLNGPKSLRIEGGYSANFSTRDIDNTPSIVGYTNVNFFNSGAVSLDGLTITGLSGTGLFVWSPNTSVTISNCRIHDNTGSGIYVNAAKDLTVTGNVLTHNWDPTDQYSTAGLYISDSVRTSSIISDNIISGSVCRFCYGLYMSWAVSNDVISRNVIHHNSAGMYISPSAADKAPLIEWNEVYSNEHDAITLYGGSSTVTRNTCYGNGGMGINSVTPGAQVITHNITSRNGGHGISLSGWLVGSVQPIVRGNISTWNAHGISISGANGWGNTSIYPVLEYNNLFGNAYSELVHSVEYPWAFEDETPGAYGELNAPAWSNNNMSHDPGFVDEANGDFSLRSDSFMIDEGDPEAAFSSEPAPNGGRVNLGLYGNTAQAERAPSDPHVSDLSAWVEGGNIVVSFDAATYTATNWMTLEYSNGGGYLPVAASALSGTGVVRGYRAARIATAANRLITWQGGAESLPASPSSMSVRLTLEHGNASSSATAEVCTNCAGVNDDPTPTPVPIETPTAVPTSTPTSAPTVVATPTRTPRPTATPIATSTPKATPKPKVTATPTRVPTLRPTRTPRPTATVTPTRTPRAKPTVTPKPKVKKKTVSRKAERRRAARQDARDAWHSG
jgi:parallel beta-helix repeat protein